MTLLRAGSAGLFNITLFFSTPSLQPEEKGEKEGGGEEGKREERGSKGTSRSDAQ